MVQPVSGSRQVLEAAMQAELPSCASSVSFPSIFFHQPSSSPFPSAPSSLFPPHGRIAVVPSFFLRASPSTFLPYSLERSVFYRVQPKTRLLHYSSRCLHTVSPYILYAVTWGTAEKTYRSVWLVLQLGDQDVWLGNESDPARSHSPAASASSASRFPSQSLRA